MNLLPEWCCLHAHKGRSTKVIIKVRDGPTYAPSDCVGRQSEGAISSVFEVSAILRSKVLSLVHRTAASAGVPRITTLHTQNGDFVPMLMYMQGCYKGTSKQT